MIVEPAMHGGYAVTPRPMQRHLERHFPIAVDALDHAAVLADELGVRVIDRTGLDA